MVVAALHTSAIRADRPKWAALDPPTQTTARDFVKKRTHSEVTIGAVVRASLNSTAFRAVTERHGT